MEKFFEKYINLLEENEYNKLIKIVSSIFILIAPSFSFMFLYKKDLFLSLDIFRLIIICLILNIVLFYILYILISSIAYMTNYLKLEDTLIYPNKKKSELSELKERSLILQKKLDEAKKYGINETELEKLIQESENMRHEIDKIDEEIDKNQELIENCDEKKITPFVMIEVTFAMVYITAIPWALYINDLLFKLNLNYELKINRYLIYVMIPLGLYLLRTIYLFLKIKNKIKKYIKLKSQ